MKEKESLLIVDDDEGARKSLSLIFGKNNFYIDTANTGQEALEKAQGKLFNIILMDIKLPDMEGIELLSALKEINPQSDVLIITAYASLETAKRAVNEGASGYITKPINMNEVLTTIKKTIEKQRYSVKCIEQYQSSQKETAELKRKVDMLEHRSNFADVIIRISSGLISTSQYQRITESQVKYALQEIGSFLNIECSDIFMRSRNGTTFKSTVEWSQDGNTTQVIIPQEVSPESFPWLLTTLLKLETVYVHNIHDLPGQAGIEKEYLISQNVKSFIVIPLVKDNALIGFMGMYTLQKARIWTEDEISLLKAITEIFTGILHPATKEKISVIVGEEKTLLRNGVCTAIINEGMNLAGEADNMDSLFDLAQQTRPDIIIMNANLPGPEEHDYIKRIKEINPDVNILIMCQDREIRYCFISTIKSGGEGALPVSSSAEQLISAIKSIYYGHSILTIEGARQLIEEVTDSTEQNMITGVLNTKEIEILTLASKGMSNKAIGKHLSLSERTVDSRFRSIFGKTNTNSRTEAIYKALKNEWITLS